jgi:HEAT repeat protein
VPSIIIVGGVGLIVAACAAGVYAALVSIHLKRLQPLLTMLRASEAETRIKALESIADLPPGMRRLVGKGIKRSLMPGARPWDRGVGVRLAYWYLRQLFTLLGDSRANVRADGAHLLQAVLGQMSPAGEQFPGQVSQPLSRPALALVEMGAGTSLSRSSRDLGLRVMAFAELMESGLLKPTAPGQKDRAIDQLISEAMDPLGSAAKDMNVHVRRGVAEVLSVVGTVETIPLLESMLSDPAADVRAEAARGLSKLATAESAPALVALLRDPVIEVQAAAAQTLSELRAASACADILEALEKACARHPVSHRPIEVLIDSAASLAEGSPPAVERAMRVLPRPAADRLARALEATGVVGKWLMLAQDEQHGGELLLALLLSLARRGVRAPFAEALEAAQGAIRMTAAEIMGKCGDGSSAEILAPLTRDADLGVRIAAIDALGSVAQPQSCAVLAGCITDPEPGARSAAVRALENIARTARAWLQGAAPVDAQVLRSAVETAGEAIRQAAHDLDETVRAAAAKAVAAVADEEGNNLLVELALHDDSEAVRQAARASVRETRPVALEPAILVAASEADPVLRARALYLLAILNGPRVAWRLVEALNDPVTTVKEAALRCLGEVDWSEAAGRLVRHLRSPEAAMRTGVALLLGAPAGAAHLASLGECLTDPDEMVRACALDSLAAHADSAAPYRHLVSQRARDPSPVVRERASAALARLGEPPVVDRLVDGVSDADPAVRARNAVRLLELAATGSLEPLARAVDIPEAARTIGDLLAAQGAAMGKPVALALKKAARPQRLRIIAALGPGLSRAGAFDIWLEDLTDVDPEVREASAEVIGLLGDPRALAPLSAALEKDPCPQVRQAAARALRDIGGDQAVGSLLVAGREDPDPQVRGLAASLAQAVGERAAFPPAQQPGERAA